MDRVVLVTMSWPPFFNPACFLYKVFSKTMHYAHHQRF
jgi:hypothetical protein